MRIWEGMFIVDFWEFLGDTLVYYGLCLYLFEYRFRRGVKLVLYIVDLLMFFFFLGEEEVVTTICYFLLR